MISLFRVTRRVCSASKIAVGDCEETNSQEDAEWSVRCPVIKRLSRQAEAEQPEGREVYGRTVSGSEGASKRALCGQRFRTTRRATNS